MKMKLIALFLVGVTLGYAGILSLMQSFYVGLGMVLMGIMLGAMPAWKVFRPYWKPSGKGSRFSPRAGRGRRKVHLTVINGNREDPPTYH